MLVTFPRLRFPPDPAANVGLSCVITKNSNAIAMPMITTVMVIPKKASRPVSPFLFKALIFFTSCMRRRVETLVFKVG